MRDIRIFVQLKGKDEAEPFVFTPSAISADVLLRSIHLHPRRIAMPTLYSNADN